MEQCIQAGYTIAVCLYALGLFAHLFRWNRLSLSFSLSAVIVNAAILVLLTLSSRHLPVFGLFEGLMTSAFVLGSLGILHPSRETNRWDVLSWVWIEVLFLLTITFFFPKGPSFYRSDDTFAWVVMFHGLRNLALGAGLFSAAHFFRYRFNRNHGALEKDIFRQGRNYLLLTTVLFLCSEYAGMIWCQMGWGDFWHWSGTFFQSALIILSLMVAFHIPGKLRFSDNVRSVAGLAAVLLMLAIRVSKGLLI